eukprot:scaffold7167_cov62-Isochrysis_galbana.AAC.2
MGCQRLGGHRPAPAPPPPSPQVEAHRPPHSPAVDLHIRLLYERHPQLLNVGRMRAHGPAAPVHRQLVVDEDAPVDAVELETHQVLAARVINRRARAVLGGKGGCAAPVRNRRWGRGWLRLGL